MPARTLRVGDDDAAIARWLKRVDDAGDSDYRREPGPDGTEITVNYTGSESVFGDGAPAGGTRRAPPLTPPGRAKAVEVVGIPPAPKGFPIVAIAPPELRAPPRGRTA